jgi:hypothetical protein
MTKEEALDLALEALEAWLPTFPYLIEKKKAAITAIKQARALDKKAENARALGLDYEPVGLIDRLTNPEDHYEFTDPKKANAVLMSLCQEAADALAAPAAPVQPVPWSQALESVWAEPDDTPPAAQPAVPDALFRHAPEHPQYVEGWNDCRAEMLKGMK